MIAKYPTHNFDYKKRNNRIDASNIAFKSSDDLKPTYGYVKDLIESWRLADLEKIIQSGFSTIKTDESDPEKQKQTLLMVASSSMNPEVTKLILKTDSSNINNTDSEGQTAIMKAFIKYHSYVNADVLLEYNPDLNIKDNNNKTVVDFLMQNNYLSDGKKVSYFSKFLEKGLKMDINSEATHKMIFLAMSEGNIDIIRKYLELNGSPDITTPNNTTLAMEAVLKQKPEIAELLLDYHANVKLLDDFKNSLLSLSSQKGYYKLLKRIMPIDNDINRKNNNGENSLMLVVQSFGDEALELILKNKPQFHDKDNEGNTALMNAAAKGNVKAMRKLIESVKPEERSKLVNDKNNRGYSPLMRASIGGYDDAINLLIDNNAKIEERSNKFVVDNEPKYSDPGGRTPLILAVKNNKTSTTELLIDRGADKDNPDDELQTPLIIAVKGGCSEPGKKLIQKGANLNKADIKKMTALMHSVYIPSTYQNLVNELINTKADLNLRDENEFTAIMHASKARNPEWVKLLHEAGATVTGDDINKSGMYSLFSTKNDKYADNFLIDGVNVDIPDKWGNTSLLNASQKGDLYRVQKDLSHKANINYQNTEGKTALMLVSDENDYVQVAETLLKHDPKPDLELKDYKNGSTALMHAYKTPGIAEKLLQAGAKIDNTDNMDRTFLMYIAGSVHGDPKVIDLALKYIPDIDKKRIINMKDKEGNGAIDIAANNGLVYVVNTLLRNGADADPEIISIAKMNEIRKTTRKYIDPYKFDA